LTQLQYLQERLFPLKARFDTSHSVVRSLMELAEKFYTEGYYEETLNQVFSNSLGNFASKYQGHSTSADLLVSRVAGLIKLVTFSFQRLHHKTALTTVELTNDFNSFLSH
jgi:hypothetical protein